MYKLIAFSKWCDKQPLAEQARALQAAGFDGVDMPCRQSSAITHATAPARLAEAQKIFADHGVPIVRLVCDIIDEADGVVERFLETLNRLGIRKIRAGGFAVPGDADVAALFDRARRRVAQVEKLLAKHGVAGGIQNHSGNCLEVNVSSTLRLLQDCDPRWLGVQYDPGHLTLAGEPPRLALGWLGPYLHSVNFKSPRQEYDVDPASGRLYYVPVWVPLRSGMLNAPLALATLRQAGYRDAISIHCEYRSYFFRAEPYAAEVNRLVKDDVDYLRALMRAGRDE